MLGPPRPRVNGSKWTSGSCRKDRLPFLALLAPSFLADGGFAAVRSEARNFGVALHEAIGPHYPPRRTSGPLRWVCRTGRGSAEWTSRDDRERQELERGALTLVFRVVFILFCESAGHLPMGNPTYEKVSLSSLVREAHDTMARLSSASSSLWSGFVRLVRAMRDGNPAWDVPAYNGALFAARDFDGAELLERLELRDPVFAKVLVAIGQDQETRRGADFSTLEIAHIGHTYESLLSLKLSLAKRSVRYDAKKGSLRSSARQRRGRGKCRWAAVADSSGGTQGGRSLLHARRNRPSSGGAGGPSGLRAPSWRGRRDRKDGPREGPRSHLLSFAVVDPACGSAHFLVQVAETSGRANGTLSWPSIRFPPIVESMDRLRSGGSPGVEIDDMALLRRLLVKHCVFGVDVSPMGAEVATLSLWLASFVPGLSLSYLGRNVVVGDSLIGVADSNDRHRERQLLYRCGKAALGQRRPRSSGV